MPQSPNKALLGCVTLLTTYFSTNLGHIKASEISIVPDSLSDEHGSDVNTTEQADVTEIANATVTLNAQRITPDNNDLQPDFSDQAVLPESDNLVSTITSGNRPTKLETLSSRAIQRIPADSSLLPKDGSSESVESQIITKTKPLSNDLEEIEQEPSVSLASIVEATDNDQSDTQTTVIANERIEPENNEAIQVAQQPIELLVSPPPSQEQQAIIEKVAQLPIEPPVLTPTPQEQEVIEELLNPSLQEDSTPYRSSPAITISNPSGFGADNFTGFVGVGYQGRTRFGNSDDGGAVVGIGLGDARENVGVQLSYTVASFGGSRDFGAGGFNVKLHRRLAEDWSVALGWEGIITTDSPVDFKDSIYGSVSHLIRTRESIDQPFSRVALTAGVGSGRFRTEDDVFDDRDTVGVFGSVAVRVAEPVSAIVEWTGQDLAAGLSVVPFKGLPIVFLPAVRDITGAGDGARFVMGAGVSFKL